MEQNHRSYYLLGSAALGSLASALIFRTHASAVVFGIEGRFLGWALLVVAVVAFSLAIAYWQGPRR